MCLWHGRQNYCVNKFTNVNLRYVGGDIKAVKEFLMNRKFCFVLLVFMLVGMGGIFAQENSGFIKPTYSVGFAVGKMGGYSETLTALGLDVDFVNSLGITLGLQTLMAWNDDVGAEPFVAFGVGYTYTATKWDAGAKLMSVPYGDGGIGFNANGTWWFRESIGLTGLLGHYTSLSSIDWSIFSLRLGVSMKI